MYQETLTAKYDYKKSTSIFFGALVFLFFSFLPILSAEAAVSHSTASESHTGSTGSVSEASFSWTHTEAGSPEGVLVFVTTVANADYIDTVTYGGVTMTQIDEAADTANEPARVTAFFLGSGIPTGNQTVVVNRTNNATIMYAAAATVQADIDTEVTGVVLLQNNQTYSEQVVDDGSLSANSLRYAAGYSGGNNVLSSGANSTSLNSIDFGSYTSTLVRETTAGQGSRPVGFSYGNTDDVAAVHLAVREIPSLYFAGTLYTDIGVTNAGAGKVIKMAVGTTTPSVFSTTTDSNGFWEFSGIDLSTATSVTAFTIWLDGDPSKATTLVSGYGVYGIRNIPLYYGHTIISARTSSDILDLYTADFYDSVDDLDITYTINTSTTTTVSGDFFINKGIFRAPAGSLNVPGNFTNQGSVTDDGGNIVLTGTSKSIDGSLTGVGNIRNIVIEGSYSFATTSASTTNITIKSGGSLTAPAALSVYNNFNNLGSFDNNGGVLYHGKTTGAEYLTPITGRDIDGSTGTNQYGHVTDMAFSGNYLYLVHNDSNGTTCSQTAGSARGCELQVYDISSSINPVYVAGRDVDGSATGANIGYMFRLVIKGDFLYVTQADQVGTACSQTAGSARGCELQVYDISSSTNPVYVAGRDISGSSSGTVQSSMAGITYSGNYLYIGTGSPNTGNCSQSVGSASGCELQVYDISSSTNPTYVAGRDGTGSASSGWYDYDIWADPVVVGDYLYIAQQDSDGVACSQTVGSAQGCELKVYDISTPSNPIYVAGRDVSGSTTGDYSQYPNALYASGDYLYMGLSYDLGYNCSQTIGSAQGCELQVYDISSSTNPIYVAGRDVDGSDTGNVANSIFSIIASGDYMYVGSYGDTSACTQIAGSAEDCEIKVYDITDPTNPNYLVGYDLIGTKSGNEDGSVESLALRGSTLYVGTSGEHNASCSGYFDDCELQVYKVLEDYYSDITGNLTGSNELGDVITAGYIRFIDNATTSDFIITEGSTVLPPSLTVTGDYQNSGTVDFATNDYLYFQSNSSQSLSGTLSSASSLPDITFLGTGTKTVSSDATTNNFNITTGATVVASNITTVNGVLDNDGTLTANSNLYLNSTTNNDGTLTANSSLYLNNTINNTGTINVNGPGLYVSTAATNGGTINLSSSNFYPQDTFTNNGTLTAATSNIYLSKDFVNNGTLSIDGSVTEVKSVVGKYLAGVDVDASPTGTNGGKINTTAISGNYLYVGRDGNSTACSQSAGSARGCELQVYDISSSTNPVYVAGRDADASTTGNNSADINHLLISGSYLYVAQGGDGTACSQSAGSADGCELKVYDISTPASPTYVAGMDIKGSSNGSDFSGNDGFTSLAISGTRLYAGSNNSSLTACSQSSGSAQGCELQVYDISTPTSPTYLAGRNVDAAETSGGFVWGNFASLDIAGDYLYIANGSNAYTSCSQSVGSAQGCELQVYEISSSTNPVYVAGRDSSGSAGGNTTGELLSIKIVDDYMFVGRNGDSNACSQSVGSAQGCELQVYDVSSSTNPVYVAGRDVDGTATGNNAGKFYGMSFHGDSLYIGSNNTGSTACSSDSKFCEVMVFDTASSTNPIFISGLDTDASAGGTEGGSVYSVLVSGERLYLGGDSSNNNACSQIAGSAEGCELKIYDFSGPTLSGSLTGANAFDDVLVKGVGVTFGNSAGVSDLTIQSGKVTAPAVLTIKGDLTNGGEFDSNGGEVIFSGTSNNLTGTTTFYNLTKVATTTSTTTFEAGSLTTVEGEWKFKGVSQTFAHALRSSVDGEYWYVDPQGTTDLSRLNVKDSNNVNVTTVTCTNCIDTANNVNWTFATSSAVEITLDNHSIGQVSNEFSFQNKTDEALYAFSLQTVDSDITISDLILSLTGIQDLDTSNLTNFKLYKDNNSDRAYDGGDTLVDGVGILTINGQNGAVTFSSDFAIASSTYADYIITADLTSINKSSAVVMELLSSGLTAVDATLVVTNTVSNIQHYRNFSGGGGGSSRIGGTSVPGAGTVTGGEEGGGSGAGQEDDGENIASDPDFYKPTATGANFNEWTNGTNALLSDGTYATAASANLKQSFTGFNFNIPTGNTIQGLAVKLDASGTTAAGTIDVSISWDGGSSYTTVKATPTLTGSDIVYLVGGGADTWGRTWTDTEFSPSNFILRVSANPSSNTLRLDAIEIRVYHQTGGGGGGGGGRV